MLGYVRVGVMVSGATVSALSASTIVLCLALVALTVALMIGLHEMENGK